MSVTRTTKALSPPVVLPVVLLLLLLLLEPPQPAATKATAATARSPSLMWWSMPFVRFLFALLAALPVGHSVSGRVLAPVVIGSAPPAHRLLVVGCIHGTERAGLSVTRALARSGVLPGAEIVVLP